MAKKQNFSDPEPLLNAAKDGDAKQVAELLAAGIDPNLCHPTMSPTPNELGVFGHVSAEDRDEFYEQGNEYFGWTALHLAARYGHVEIVRQLIAAGADVNANSRFNERPLHCAFLSSFRKWGESATFNETQEAIIRLLIEGGADLNAADSNKETPLLIAMLLKDGVRLVKILVEAGADIHAQGLLHEAIEWNKPKVVQVLLTAKKVHLKRKRNRKTPLELAKSKDHRQIIRLLERAEKNKNR